MADGVLINIVGQWRTIDYGVVTWQKKKVYRDVNYDWSVRHQTRSSKFIAGVKETKYIVQKSLSFSNS